MIENSAGTASAIDTTRATLAGFSAIMMWALLALFTAASGDVPPFQLLAITFTLGGCCGLLFGMLKPHNGPRVRVPVHIMVFGIAGLFGYHFFYYSALRNAPVAEASLIAYLWPLLIVLGSALLPGEKLRWYHIIGAILGFSGAALLIGPDGFGSGNAFGYAAALACAFIWSSYSVLSRLFKETPTRVVTLYCLATAGLSLVCHLVLEVTVWPETGLEWLAIIGLGTMPVGLAFYVWDIGMKRGNIQLLGSLAYGAPVLSTLVLVGAGYAEPGRDLVIACLLVTAGALVASGRFFKASNKEQATVSDDV